MKVKGIASTIAMLEKTMETKSKLLITKLAEATPVDTGDAAKGWKLVDGQIVNSIDYISELNKGSSTQAPAHFVEQVVLQDRDFKVAGIIVKYT